MYVGKAMSSIESASILHASQVVEKLYKFCGVLIINYIPYNIRLLLRLWNSNFSIFSNNGYSCDNNIVIKINIRFWLGMLTVR